ncbi:MAG: MFS transporter [Candidatus Altiarchaeales archaeon]|nr:MAG: MFS transporter [Candidatus Altiarchaeales archaeon]HDO82814.1 MFS transporter [Candidatus Altiarchaeales archaeon]HEX55463.1 MFS transporter [Candidatus Altiarchaeales archaeon]
MRIGEKNTIPGGKNVILLGIVSFLNDLSSEMIIPILPVFIKLLGGGGIEIGLIAGLRDSVSSLLNVISGYLSDKTGKRKVFVCSGYLTSAIFKFLLSFSSKWQHVLLFTSLERVGKGIRTSPRDSILSESMPREKGKGFGIHRAFDEAGAILGTISAFILFWFFDIGLSSIIFIAAIISFSSILPLYLVREKKRKPIDTTLRINLRRLSRELRVFILISGIFALANFSYMFFILRVEESLTGKFAIAVPILLYALFKTFKVMFSIPFGIISDRIGRKRIIILGYALFSFTCLGFAYLNSLLAFLILFSVYGIADAIIDGNQRAYVSDLSKERVRSTALGTFHTVNGIMTLPSSVIAGFLWNISHEMTFIYGGIMSLIAVLFLLTIFRRENR